MTRFRLGLVVNPIAGIGGPAALKGSDGPELQAAARAAGYRSLAPARTREALANVKAGSDAWEVVTWGGMMGASCCSRLDVPVQVVGEPAEPCSASDTRAAVSAISSQVDLVLFVGGDGTARDVLDSLHPQCPALGVPSGVKMHSGVFAQTPVAAGRLISRLIRGELVGAVAAEVRDIDEDRLRRGELSSRYYGEMLVPGDLSYMQHTKVSGRESEPLVLVEIAAAVVELMEPGVTWFVGAGTTTAAVKTALGVEGTLLGVDVVRDGQLSYADADAHQLWSMVTSSTRIVLSFTGGQGYLLGRGNQQLTPEILRTVGPGNVTIIGSKSKLAALQGRPLLVDTGDADLDRDFSGVFPILTGYEDQVLYRVTGGSV